MLNKAFNLWAIISLCCFLSCKKYLDQKSDNTLVTPNTLADLQGLLDDNTTMNSNTPGFGETCSDDYFVTQDVYNSIDLLSQKAYTWTLQDYNYPDDWATCYNAIYNCNYSLDQLKNITINESNLENWNIVKGSALFYRSYYFLDLLWDYSKAYDSSSANKDLGIVLRLSSNFNEPSARASVEAGYSEVIKDLREAATLLPGNNAQPMRPSGAAAFATLARAFLSMRKYDSAFKYASAALQLNHGLLDYNSVSFDSTSAVSFAPFNNEIIFFSTQSGNYTTKLYFYALVDSTLAGSYSNYDLRRYIFLYQNNNFFGFKGNYAASLYPSFSGIATDELYLIKAESEVRLGNVDEGINDLNTLLAKRWKTGTFIPIHISDKEDALDTILLERRKELLIRGLRWIDIKRLNKEGADIMLQRVIGNQTFTLAPNSDYYALPLPQDVIKQGHLQQN